MGAIDDFLRALVNLFEGLPALLKFIVAILFEKLLGDYFWYTLAFVVGAIATWWWTKQSSASRDNK